MLITEAKAKSLVFRLVKRYVEVGKQANLTKASLAKIAGVSQSRFYQVAKTAEAGQELDVSAYAFLRIKQALSLLEQDLEGGDLPVRARSNSYQQEYLDR